MMDWLWIEKEKEIMLPDNTIKNTCNNHLPNCFVVDTF
jgi:hypothetical protein